MLHVALALGLRRGELLGLRWEDINFQEGTVHIRRAIINERNKVVMGSLKTKGSQRMLYMPPIIRTLLQTHRDRQALDVAAAKTWEDPGWVFATGKGTPIGPNNFLRAYRQLLEKAGLPREHRLHDLRHSYASWLIANGVDPRTLSDLLGHADPRFTMSVYVHAQEETRRRAANLTDHLLANLLKETG